MFRYEVRNLRQVLRALDKIEPKMRRRVLVKALSKAGGVFKTAAQRMAPRETGLLSKSLGVKRAKSARGGVQYRVQPRKNFRRVVTIDKRGRLKALGTRASKTRIAAGISKRRIRNPQRYGHLVELGHDVVFRNRRTGQRMVVGEVAGSHFLKRAFRSKERTAIRVIIGKIRQEMKRP